MLGLQKENFSSITPEDIRRAYREKSREYHPDKNKSPDAPEKLLEVRKAYEVLSDEAARTAYDNLLKMRMEREKRYAAMDSKIGKMKRELEEREEQWRRKQQEEEEAKRKLQQEIERIRAESKRKMEEAKKRKQQEQELKQKQQQDETKSEDAILKVSWDSSKGDYSKERLEQIFKLFGQVDYVLVSKKQKKRKKDDGKELQSHALVAFRDIEPAYLASSQKLGDSNNYLKITWASGAPPARPKLTNITTSEEHVPAHKAYTPMTIQQHEEFEAQILSKLRKAAESQNG